MAVGVHGGDVFVVGAHTEGGVEVLRLRADVPAVGVGLMVPFVRGQGGDLCQDFLRIHHATILEFDGESVRATKAKARSIT